MSVQDFRKRIHSALEHHEEWRRQTLNLSAAENSPSPAVHHALCSDLLNRYANYSGREPTASKYQGTRHIQEIETATIEIAQELFHAKFVELRAISGSVANMASILSLVEPGGLILEAGEIAGGYQGGRNLCNNPLINFRSEDLPFNPFEYSLDLTRTISMMRKLRPNLILLGTASLLFPLPVAEICTEARRLENISVAYDASNVLGLIAGGQFQDPLADGVDLLFGSTHHTLPGPQGALILTNNFRAASAVSTAVYPTLVNNHHLGRIPGLATALLEMLEFGKVYAAQMVANARALGAEILRLGIPVVAAHKGFTQSHVILLQTSQLDDHKLLAERLEKAGIIVNICHLPHELGDQGLRIGVQEITHQGAMETDMLPIATFIVDILRGTRSSESVAGSVAEFRKQFQQAYYTFPEES